MHNKPSGLLSNPHHYGGSVVPAVNVTAGVITVVRVMRVVRTGDDGFE